jgi:ribosomal protein L7/L12
VAYSHDNVIDKLLKLNERVAVNKVEIGKETDLIWCQRLITDVKDSGLVPNIVEFNMANLMWKKYNGGVKSDNKVMWSIIDMLLTQENPSKIQAIKILRKYIECSLREAKELVDAREIKIKKGW